jgi:hypothetical protein
VSQPGLAVKSVVGALRRLLGGLDLDTGGRLGRLHMRVHLRWMWVSWWARRLLVVTGARCPRVLY